MRAERDPRPTVALTRQPRGGPGAWGSRGSGNGSCHEHFPKKRGLSGGDGRRGGLRGLGPPQHPQGTAGGAGRLTYEGFDCAVDVLVLLEAGGRGEGLAAVGAGVRPRPDVLGPDVPLQVAGVREHLGHRCRRPAPVHVPWPPDGSAGRSAPCPSPCCSGDPRGASESCRGSPRARSLPP